MPLLKIHFLSIQDLIKKVSSYLVNNHIPDSYAPNLNYLYILITGELQE